MVTGFFQKLLNIFEYAKGNESEKLNIYLGHDKLIQAICTSLKIDLARTPEFASFFTFELHHNTVDDQYTVIARYNGETRLIQDCGDQGCSYDSFVELLSDLSLDDFDYMDYCDNI